MLLLGPVPAAALAAGDLSWSRPNPVRPAAYLQPAGEGPALPTVPPDRVTAEGRPAATTGSSEDPADEWLPDPDSMGGPAPRGTPAGEPFDGNPLGDNPMDDAPLYDTEGPSPYADAVADEPVAFDESGGYEELNGGAEEALPGHRAPVRSFLSQQRQTAWPRFHQPLRGETWLRRPWSVSYFAGGMFGDQLIPGRVDQQQGFFTGGRVGWDFDLHWGMETRVGYASIGLVTTPPAEGTDHSRTWVVDSSLLYYPFGDNRWRPYFQLGLGLVDVLYFDENRTKLHETLFGLPVGGGIKYRWSDRVVMRFDVLDNLAFAGSKTSTLNNLSISLGLELRFGGPRRSYWPWDPNSLYW